MTFGIFLDSCVNETEVKVSQDSATYLKNIQWRRVMETI